MKLYGHPDSGHAFKVKFCLNAAGIDHDYEFVDIFSDREVRDPEFLQRSKFCEVPLLTDHDKSLIQSNAILIYIATEYKVFGGLSSLELQACMEWLVWEANKIGLCLPQLRADKKFKVFELSVGAKDWLTNRYYHDVGILERELSDGRKFILGDKVTIADFSLSGYLMYDNEADVKVPEKVHQWLSRLKNLDGWSTPYDMLAKP